MADDLRTIQADTAEQALALAHDEFGPNARILAARKVLRGGVGGFFQREVVELEVRAGDTEQGTPVADARALDVDGDAPVADALHLDRETDEDDAVADSLDLDADEDNAVADALGLNAEEEERSFAEVLRARLEASTDGEIADEPTQAADTAVDGGGEDRGEDASMAFRSTIERLADEVTSSDDRAAAPVARDVPAAAAAAEREASAGHASTDEVAADGRRAGTDSAGAHPNGSSPKAHRWPTATDEEIADAEARDRRAPVGALPAGSHNGAGAVGGTNGRADLAGMHPAPSVGPRADRPSTSAAPSGEAAPSVTAPTASAPPASDADGVRPAPGGPAWSSDVLRRLGLPAVVVDSTVDLDPADDIAWVSAIARAVTPFCGPLPSGPTVLAGPRVHSFAQALDVPIVEAPTLPDAEVVAARLKDPADLSWLTGVARDRRLHVVLGADAWRRLLLEDVQVVSWSTAWALPDAIRVAAEFDVALGYRLEQGRAVRATPLDIALAVRALVPVR